MSSASSRKEPSMDEILASIRRIIESGDEATGRKASSAGTLSETPLRGTSADLTPAPMPRFDIHYVSPDEEEVEEEVVLVNDLREIETANFSDGYATDRAGDEASDDDAEPHGYVALAEEAEPDASRSDRHAVRAWPDEHDHAAAVPPPAGNENSVPDDEDDAEPTERAASARNFSFEFDDDAFEAALRSDDTWHGPAPEAASESPVSPAASAPQPEKPQMPESVIEGASALLSAQAGDQVAAAFDDLTRAIRDGQMRSMEEMAREMLRPMLQEWLDDNLPRIVERLVRDEIERIARGPRR